MSLFIYVHTIEIIIVKYDKKENHLNVTTSQESWSNSLKDRGCGRQCMVILSSSFTTGCYIITLLHWVKLNYINALSVIPERLCRNLMCRPSIDLDTWHQGTQNFYRRSAQVSKKGGSNVFVEHLYHYSREFKMADQASRTACFQGNCHTLYITRMTLVYLYLLALIGGGSGGV